MYPSQTDFVMAYLQVKMKEQVFIKFPEFWAQHLPDNLKPYCGVPLRLLKALYGYTYSGKFLFEEQAAFFAEYGLRQTAMPALWVKHTSNGGILLILHHSDDLLAASSPLSLQEHFISKLKEKFTIEHQDQADWYLRARLRQDKQGNIYLDQQQYSKAIVNRYLSTADPTPSEQDLVKYASPQLSTFKWTKADNSKNFEELEELEKEYGIRFIELLFQNCIHCTEMLQAYAPTRPSPFQGSYPLFASHPVIPARGYGILPPSINISTCIITQGSWS
jgi:hypothetical protein